MPLSLAVISPTTSRPATARMAGSRELPACSLTSVIMPTITVRPCRIPSIRPTVACAASFTVWLASVSPTPICEPVTETTLPSTSRSPRAGEPWSVPGIVIIIAPLSDHLQGSFDYPIRLAFVLTRRGLDDLPVALCLTNANRAPLHFVQQYDPGG